MCLPSFIVDQDIIKEEKEKMVQKGLKYIVHNALKSGRCITKTKRNHQEVITIFICVRKWFEEYRIH
jgi:hypothetical protein